MKKTILRMLLLSSAALTICFLLTVIAVAQTVKPTPQPTPRRPLPKLPNGARGFDNKSKDSTARLIAIGGGYGAGEDEEPLPKLRRKTALGYYRLGDEMYNRGKMNQAVAALETAVKLNPSFVKAYWRLGNAYAEYNNLVDESKYDDQECYRRAIVAFEQVRRLQPGRAGVYNNLGVLYFNTNQYEKAAKAFEEGLRLKPKGKENDMSLAEGGTREDLYLYIYIGDAYERLEKNELALEYFQRAKNEASENSRYVADSIAARMALVYEKLGDTEKALTTYEAIDLTNGFFDYEATDRSGEINQRMGLLYAAKMDYERAANSLVKAIEGFAERMKGQNESEPVEDESSESKAERLKDVEATKSAMASASYNLGVVYLNLNKTEDAVAAFQKVIDLEPGNAEARFNLGFAYHSLGNKEAARVQLEALKLIDTDLAKELETLLAK